MLPVMIGATIDTGKYNKEQLTNNKKSESEQVMRVKPYGDGH
jgi:hypothetical protein